MFLKCLKTRRSKRRSSVYLYIRMNVYIYILCEWSLNECLQHLQTKILWSNSFNFSSKRCIISTRCCCLNFTSTMPESEAVAGNACQKLNILRNLRNYIYWSQISYLKLTTLKERQVIIFHHISCLKTSGH